MRKLCLCLALLSCASPLPSSVGICSEEPPILLLGRVIDGTGAPAIEEGAVLVRGSLIEAVGAASDLVVPPDATIMDLAEATILPGFVNAHAHNACPRGHRALWARAGVTTVRDLGIRYDAGWADCLLEAADAPREADIVWAGPLVTVPGGYPICGNNFRALTVITPEDGREKVEGLIEAGADLIKITITTGGHCPTLSLSAIQSITEAAHAYGLPVSAHVELSEDVERALAGGVDDLAHVPVDPMSNDLISRLVDRGVSVVSTLAALPELASVAGGNLLRFARAGGVVAFGNDGGFLPGLTVGMPIEEVRALSGAGFSPMEILVAATRSAAQVCGLGDVVGTLEAGKQADILVVDGNPLDDLEVLTSELVVLHRGVLITDQRPQT